jgi:hypothetical protein
MLEIALRPPGLKEKGEVFSSSDIKNIFFGFARAQTMTVVRRFDPVTDVLRDDTVDYVSVVTTPGRVI